MTTPTNFRAIADTDESHPQGVLNLGDSQMANMYNTYALEFSNPLVDKPAMTLLLSTAHTAFTAWQNNHGDSETLALAVAIAALFAACKKNILYTNMLYPGDLTKIQHSGNPSSKERSKHGLPFNPSINRAEKCKTEVNAAKVFINKRTGTEEQISESVIYYLFKSLSADGSNAVLTTITNSKYKLIARNLTVKEDIWLWVVTSNATGESELSPKVKYTLV